jgi:hypothetical protein
MKIEYGIGGRRAGSLEQFTNELEKMVSTQFTDCIKKRVRNVICPEHGLHPTVKVKGRTSDKIEFEVNGCCQKLIDVVNTTLR